MYKKLSKLFCLVLTLLVLASPVLVKADQISLKTSAYSTTVTTGNELTFALDVKQNDFQGTISFDNNALEFVDIKIEYAGDGPYAGSLGTVTKTVSNGTVSVNYSKGNNPVTLLAVFKAKAVPNGGKTTIKAIPSGNMWLGQPESTITIVAEKECATVDGKECPVCETCKECDKTASESKDNNEILLYGSLGACGVLAIAVIILAVKKK